MIPKANNISYLVAHGGGVVVVVNRVNTYMSSIHSYTLRIGENKTQSILSYSNLNFIQKKKRKVKLKYIIDIYPTIKSIIKS